MEFEHLAPIQSNRKDCRVGANGANVIKYILKYLKHVFAYVQKIFLIKHVLYEFNMY